MTKKKYLELLEKADRVWHLGASACAVGLGHANHNRGIAMAIEKISRCFGHTTDDFEKSMIIRAMSCLASALEHRLQRQEKRLLWYNTELMKFVGAKVDSEENGSD